MLIDTDILITWGAVYKKFEKHQCIFEEGTHAKYYHQIVEGDVKMFNINEDGKEFIQGIFKKGESFGEPPLFIEETYPASAMTLHDCIILRLNKESFHKLLNEYPQIQANFIHMFARRIYNKSITAKEIANNNPEHRILAFMKSYKHNNCNDCPERVLIPYTRQEIANFTGLRVETVIRALIKMNEQKIVHIDNRKVYF